MKRIFFAVTNDLSYDQRMIRICNSLAAAGYAVTLVGRKMKNSVPLSTQIFEQRRLPCFFHSGKSFYIEYNIRLFLFLLFQRIGCICAIDLDTILPCYAISVLKRVPRVYDAHELFCEMKEVVTRPRIYRLWKRIEKFAVARFRWGYTVNQPIADEFRAMYNVDYTVIRNFPVLQNRPLARKDRFILYQGAVNHGRSFESLIPAMKEVDAALYIFGDGNFFTEAQALVKQHALQEKVRFQGKLAPPQLREITQKACIGITLFENNGLSNYLSLANRFTDYVHAAVPQVCSNFPVYREMNNQYRVAVLLDELSPPAIANALNSLLTDDGLYNELHRNCFLAREVWNWQVEEKELLRFYQNVFTEGG